MSTLLIVVDTLEDWSPYFPSGDVISFEEYLNLPEPKGRVRVINLCRSRRYLSPGYYCSLLAEARQHHILPSLKVINDLSRRALYQLQLVGMIEQLQRLQPQHGESELRFRSFFGDTAEVYLRPLAQELFERLPCPMLEVALRFKGDRWQVKELKLLGLSDLTTEGDQDLFARALDQFSRKIWRKPSARKPARYDLAILVDPEESLPPSDPRALKRFIKAAAKVGIEAELIGRRDLQRLAEFDALFIRKTTAIDDYTYRFAKKAESEGLVVIDDPASIMRCCNKVYLSDLLRRHKIPAPRTEILCSSDEARLHEVAERLGYPIVLKIPDGSFSRGMAKVDDWAGLREHSRGLLKQSALVLAQEFLYTEYDWRIGVLNQKPLYACRYYMAKKHWQIYKHGEGAVQSGGFDTLPTFEVPKPVLQVAMKASKLIGDGLYGIDIKQSGNRAVVIEVNDNPSIDSGVEDKYLGDELYLQVMQEFARRLELRGRHD
ncbi:RimK family protein [Motiliproteus sediminis]|uniref:RimK family protein n=1 Tax=Motiliproteus sediminis TaxID=1468178 RepID=UPI001AEF6ED5|nr:RimK family protein [Motiliproteus sediminis]